MKISDDPNEKQKLFDSYYGKGDFLTINKFERDIGYGLPVAYKSIVSEYNGAFVVNKNAFRFYSQFVEREVVFGVGLFLPYGSIDGVTETMELKRRYPPEGFNKGLVVFSALGNGDALCFDYRECLNDNPPVVVWHHEGMSEESGVSLVADSFEGFLQSLYEENDDDD
ncbi:SMI1/KNR4 family protein [Pseudomonas sp. NFXW11]|uniref:SMI1/KNR4 family protein n=1 Tax=Pseudomonas sp. NFXW11 TaxID=2819531 RepID=UPI003CF96CDC